MRECASEKMNEFVENQHFGRGNSALLFSEVRENMISPSSLLGRRLSLVSASLLTYLRYRPGIMFLP